MPASSAQRFRILLDVARLGILLRDETLTAISALGRRLAPRQAWRSIEVPRTGHPVRISLRAPHQDRMLEACFVQPDGPAAASILLFHGIGDRIAYWRRVQQRFATAGFSSLSFHYAGYGQSYGQTTPENLVLDAHAAYAWLVAQHPGLPCFLMGFSLGTGLAAEVANALHPPAAGLILCEAYTTLRRAAMRVVRPVPFAARLMPDLWRTVDNVARLGMPLLIVHSSADALFPAEMAEELHAAALAGGVSSTLRIFPGYAHNAPYLLVPDDYWTSVTEFVAAETAQQRR
jgi:alpha-beta hydrolase superfamily lysophospholipase